MSTIAELRTLFTSRSGDINMAAADVDRYINSGVELLDLLTEFSHAPTKQYAELAIGDTTINFSSKSRVVKEVWVIDAVDGRSKLKKVNHADLREQYADVPDVTGGKPLYFSMDIQRAHPTNFDETTLPLAFRAHIDTTTVDYNIDSILFMPPADEVYVLEVIGKFHSPTLTDAYTENWWSVNYPDLTLLAAMYQLEAHYRNTEGMNDYMNSMRPMLSGIDKDQAEEASVDYEVMRG